MTADLAASLTAQSNGRKQMKYRKHLIRKHPLQYLTWLAGRPVAYITKRRAPGAPF